MNKELQDAFIANMNLEAMAKEISAIVKNLTKLEVAVTVTEGKSRKGELILQVASENVADKAFPVMFKELSVINFGGNLMENENIYWLPISFRYEMFDGGYNCSDIVKIFFKPSGEVHSLRTNHQAV